MQQQAPEVLDLQKPDYRHPKESCDLVMKGGVTSGVVYPTAICRLARKFRFRSIGGTSAGALAAALAAAAEHERQTAASGAESVGFQRLAKVPAYLGTGTGLLDLFQPSPRTAPLFRLAISWLRKPKLPALLMTALGVYPGVAALALVWAVVVFVVLAFAIWYVSSVSSDPDAVRRAWIIGVAAVVTVIAAALSCVALIVIGLGRRVLAGVLHDVADNAFGLCTGFETPGPSAPRPLTRWLADRIDHVAGRSAEEDQPEGSALAPLTFGELYGIADSAQYPYPAGLSPVLDALNTRGSRVVNLEMVTTDVTAGRPYRLPFDPHDPTKFFYDPTEFARFFPKRVLDRMSARATPITIEVKNVGAAMLLPFPDAPDLPLVVAARMSMSFPLLFSAVPLYAVNRGAFERGCGAAKLEVRKTWFSDGGLSSNIPIHFFDGPMPRWPTFALNLRGFPRTVNGCEDPSDWSKASDSDKVFLATRYDPDVEVFANAGNGRLFQFVNSLIDAMQNWNDNTLMQLPGYRERTVEIAMSADEGGLNLVMPQTTLKSIMRRGFYAGEAFDSAFATPLLENSDAWNNHRQIRLRSSLLMQSEWTRRFHLAWTAPLVPAYSAIVSATASPPYVMPYSAVQVPSALNFAQHLADAPKQIVAGVTLTDKPSPSPELRARPRV